MEGPDGCVGSSTYDADAVTPVEIENDRVRQHLEERGIASVTIGLMAAADRNMRQALHGVDGKWALEFSWETAQAVAHLVEISEIELYAQQTRLKLVEHLLGCLNNVSDRRARRRALKLLKRITLDASEVAGHAVRPRVADPVVPNRSILNGQDPHFSRNDAGS